MGPLDDQTLVESAKRGNRDAFGSLIERHQKTVFNIAYRMVRDRETAMDLAQETFVQALSHLDGFEQSRPFAPWLYRIVHNRSLNYLKRAAHRSAPRAVADDNLQAMSPTTSESHSPEGQANLREFRRNLVDEVDKLPENLKSAFVLRYLEDRTVADVAEILGLPLNTIKTHLFRARKQLRSRLREFFEEHN